MGTTNLLVSDRIANAAVDTFVSEVTKNMPGDADYLVRKQVKNDAWGVVTSRHPITNEWRDAWQAYMTACNGVHGLKNATTPMPPKALLWKSVVSGAGGSMKKVYREANGRVATSTKAIDASPYVQGRNMATVNRVTDTLQGWVRDNNRFPSTRLLDYFTAFESALWDVAIERLTEAGYKFTATSNGYDVTGRPPVVTKGEISEYIKALPKQDRIALVTELLSS